MINIKITTSFPDWPLIYQTPNAKGIWGDCKFFINEPVNECDWWVVYEGLTSRETVLCPPHNIIFISGEPQSFRKYKRSFLSQFPKIISSHRLFLYKNVLRTQQALPWHIGIKRPLNTVRYGYDELANMQEITKSKLLSVIISSKAITAGHRQRLSFLDALKTHFGDRLEIFGRGINEVDDKWEAIAPFRYHIVMENSQYPHYFTEKLTDSYLGGAYPFYYGCPNLSEYYSSKAFTPIDIKHPSQAIDIIERGIASGLYSLNQKHLHEAREMTLNKYNLFPMLAEFCRHAVEQDSRPITLYPEGMI